MLQLCLLQFGHVSIDLSQQFNWIPKIWMPIRYFNKIFNLKFCLKSLGWSNRRCLDRSNKRSRKKKMNKACFKQTSESWAGLFSSCFTSNLSLYLENKTTIELQDWSGLGTFTAYFQQIYWFIKWKFLQQIWNMQMGGSKCTKIKMYLIATMKMYYKL